MVLGTSLSTFTLLHVILSLAGIGSGFIVLFGLLNGKRLDGWTAIFLTTTVLTDLKKFDVPTLILHGDDDQIVPSGPPP